VQLGRQGTARFLGESQLRCFTAAENATNVSTAADRKCSNIVSKRAQHVPTKICAALQRKTTCKLIVFCVLDAALQQVLNKVLHEVPPQVMLNVKAYTFCALDNYCTEAPPLVGTPNPIPMPNQDNCDGSARTPSAPTRRKSSCPRRSGPPRKSPTISIRQRRRTPLFCDPRGPRRGEKGNRNNFSGRPHGLKCNRFHNISHKFREGQQIYDLLKTT
jgi:hypothetical protein